MAIKIDAVSQLVKQLHFLFDQSIDRSFARANGVQVRVSSICALLENGQCRGEVVDTYLNNEDLVKEGIKAYSPSDLNFIQAYDCSQGTSLLPGPSARIYDNLRERFKSASVLSFSLDNPDDAEARSIIKLDMKNSAITHYDCHGCDSTTRVLDLLINTLSKLDNSQQHQEACNRIRTFAVKREDLKRGHMGRFCNRKECNLFNLLCFRQSITTKDLYPNESERWKVHVAYELHYGCFMERILDDEFLTKSFMPKIKSWVDKCLLADISQLKAPTTPARPSAPIPNYISLCFRRIEHLLYSDIGASQEFRRNLDFKLVSEVDYKLEESSLDRIRVIALDMNKGAATRYAVLIDWKINDMLYVSGVSQSGHYVEQVSLGNSKTLGHIIGDRTFREFAFSNMRYYSSEHGIAIVLANIVASAKVYHSNGKMPHRLRLMNRLFDEFEKNPLT